MCKGDSGYREVSTRPPKREKNIELISHSGTAEIALRGLENSAANDTPDLVLLDLNLPGMSGLEAIPWFQKYVPQTKIIILTQSDRQADVLSAISQGASGYLLKSATIQQILDGIRTVAGGGASIDADMAVFLIDVIKSHQPGPAPEKALSDRELETLTLLGDGLSKKEIATQLAISITTVAYHVKHIYEKLNVPNAPAAIKKAYKSGLFPAD